MTQSDLSTLRWSSRTFGRFRTAAPTHPREHRASRLSQNRAESALGDLRRHRSTQRDSPPQRVETVGPRHQRGTGWQRAGRSASAKPMRHGRPDVGAPSAFAAESDPATRVRTSSGRRPAFALVGMSFHPRKCPDSEYSVGEPGMARGYCRGHATRVRLRWRNRKRAAQRRQSLEPLHLHSGWVSTGRSNSAATVVSTSHVGSIVGLTVCQWLCGARRQQELRRRCSYRAPIEPARPCAVEDALRSSRPRT
jgi:hypothetical protein